MAENDSDDKNLLGMFMWDNAILKASMDLANSFWSFLSSKSTLILRNSSMIGSGTNGVDNSLKNMVLLSILQMFYIEINGFFSYT